MRGFCFRSPLSVSRKIISFAHPMAILYNNNEHCSLLCYMTLVNTDIRQLILETTRNMLVEYGYYAVSMRKIATEAGCGLGTIYLYFDNKDVLFHTLIDEGFEKMYERISASVQDMNEPEHALRTACKTYVKFGIDNPEYYEIMYQLHPDHMVRYPKEKYRRARRSFELIAGIIEKMTAGNKRTTKNAKILSYSLWASLHGVASILIARRLDISINQEEFIDSVIDMAIIGLNRSS